MTGISAVPEAKTLDLPSLTEGRAASFEFTIDDDEMETFARLSGDYNPLHRDAEFGRSRGFAGRVVYGALLLAKVSRLIGMELPGRNGVWTEINMQFASPLYVGAPATLRAVVSRTSPATRSIELKLQILSGERLIARGKASVSLRDEP